MYIEKCIEESSDNRVSVTRGCCGCMEKAVESKGPNGFERLSPNGLSY